MDSETKTLERLDGRMDTLFDGDQELEAEVKDLWRFLSYGHRTLSQFGMRYCGFVCRQVNGSTTITVKVLEADIPLVAYITSATPTGCVRSFLRLLDAGKVSWHRDRYPWI